MNEKFAGWSTLFIFNLKRDWKKIIVWVGVLGLFSGGFIPAFKEIAKGDGLIGMYETLQNPAMIAMVGPTPVSDANEYTLGAMYAHEMLLFCALFAIVISILHVVSHTRKEEDIGLSEIVRSFQVGRQANALATMIEVIGINILLSLFIGGILVSFNAPTITLEGALLFGFSIGVAGVVGGSIALVFSQIMPNSTAATSASFGIIGLLYILRAGTDGANIHLSSFNPLGWSYLTYPFTKNDWTPMILSIIFVVVFIVFAFYLEGARDSERGYLPEKEGRRHANKVLLSVPGLFLRLSKGIIVSWLITFIVLGASYGSIYGDMQGFLESNDIMKEMFTRRGFSIEESATSTFMMIMIVLVAILPITLVNKLYTEEKRSHLSQIYATQVSRAKFYWSSVVIAFVFSIIGILFAAGSLGIAAIISLHDQSTMNIFDFLYAGFNFLPVVLFFISLATMCLGFLPAFGKAIYVYLGYSFLLNYFENILDLPDWFLNTSIQSLIPKLPVENFDIVPFVAITIISMVIIIISSIGYTKRDMKEEN